MVSTEIKNIVEALIFASEEEITTRQIKEITDSSGVRISVKDIESSIDSLNEDYRTFNKSFEIVQIAGGYSFSTKKEYGRFVGKLFEEKQKKKLSQSALESLSIIAYRQPITRNEIEFVRGVNVDYIVNSLLERDLIKIHGRADTPGRPILYATTNTFLKVLGLNSLEDLPKLKEINEILKNQEIEGITEADIELFNSANDPALTQPKETGQLELITSEDIADDTSENKDSIETENEIQITDENRAENSFDIIEDKEVINYQNSLSNLTKDEIEDEGINIEYNDNEIQNDNESQNENDLEEIDNVEVANENAENEFNEVPEDKEIDADQNVDEEIEGNNELLEINETDRERGDNENDKDEININNGDTGNDIDLNFDNKDFENNEIKDHNENEIHKDKPGDSDFLTKEGEEDSL